MNVEKHAGAGAHRARLASCPAYGDR